MSRGAVFLADAVVPVVVGAIMAVAVGVRADSDARPLALALALGSAAVLLARRRAPVATLAVSAGLVLVLFHVDRRAGAIAVLAPAVALYAVGLSRGRVQQVVAALAAVAAVIVADVVLTNHRTLATLGHVALVAVPLLAAEALRNRRAYVKLLLERLELAERTRDEEARRRVEQERLRIARELHDIAAHTLTTINVQAGVAAHLVERDPLHARNALATIEEASSEALDELRAVVGVLRDRDADGAPVDPTPTLDDLGGLIDRAREGGVDVRLETKGTRGERLPEAVQLAAFRIVQESLTNARRHAPGSVVHVTLEFDPDRLRISVENNGGADTAARGTGVGIIGMEERAASVGGTVVAGPANGGFRVAAELPFRRGE